MYSQHGEERHRHSGGDHEPSSHGIHIKPSHKGLLHKELGVKEGHKIPKKAIAKDLAKAKASGNVAEEKRDVFAENFGH